MEEAWRRGQRSCDKHDAVRRSTFTHAITSDAWEEGALRTAPLAATGGALVACSESIQQSLALLRVAAHPNITNLRRRCQFHVKMPACAVNHACVSSTENGCGGAWGGGSFVPLSLSAPDDSPNPPHTPSCIAPVRTDLHIGRLSSDACRVKKALVCWTRTPWQQGLSAP